MLEITSKKNFDIFKVILVLAKFNVQASVSSKKILLEDTIIPTDILKEICTIIPHYITRNYLENEIPKEINETHTELKTIDKVEQSEKKYFSTTKGDVFYCDFGLPFEHEIAYKRPAVVLWNFSDRALVLPCTTNDAIYEGKFKISFKEEHFRKR